MAPEHSKARLKELIIDKALVVRREPITLSSGQKTNHYYDLKKSSGSWRRPKAHGNSNVRRNAKNGTSQISGWS